jgi:malate dehydrogenase
MAKPVIHVAVTGGAGQIAYSLLFRIAAGEVFGNDQPIALRILEIPSMIGALEGVKMEILDCAYPLVRGIEIGADPRKIFEGVQYAFLVGAKPRGPGMERKDLLAGNAAIFIEQGKALNAVADLNVKVAVIGNPCNTNCLIALRNAPRLNPGNFFAMTRLDQNRAIAQLALKTGVDLSEITNLAIWGNHSTTLVPDYINAKIHGRPVEEVITDVNWLQKDFIEVVQKRGAAIIAARGKSSAASAASSAIDMMRSILEPTAQNDWFSMGVCTDGNPYNIEENLVFSFPCRSKGDGTLEIVKGLVWNDFLQNKIRASEKELIEERSMILQYINGASYV